MCKLFSYLFFICCISVLFSCQKEYSREVGNTTPGEGSLWDTTGDCLPSSVNGTFYNGVVPGSDTAYVEIQVNVTKTGSYNISSDLQNGFKFLDSGFFSNTGINTIHLKPIGAPFIPVSTTFTINLDSSFCSFTVDVQDSTGTGLGGDTTGTGGSGDDYFGSWQFTTDEGTFQGQFDTAVIFKDTSIWNSGGQALEFVGYVNSSQDSAITLIFYLPNNAITPGATYTTQSVPPANAALFAFNFTTGDGDPIYEAIPNNNANAANVGIKIVSYDNTTKVITGIFSGIAEDKDGNATVNVSNGTFLATVP